MNKDLIRRADAIAILEDEMPGHYLSKKTQIVAKLRAMPAYEVGVRPGEIERAVWDAMGWAANARDGRPGDIIPPYTDGGNGDAETECRRVAARIRSALIAAPTEDVAGLVDAAEEVVAKVNQPDATWDLPSRTVLRLTAALARMKEAKA